MKIDVISFYHQVLHVEAPEYISKFSGVWSQLNMKKIFKVFALFTPKLTVVLSYYQI